MLSVSIADADMHRTQSTKFKQNSSRREKAAHKRCVSVDVSMCAQRVQCKALFAEEEPIWAQIAEATNRRECTTLDKCAHTRVKHNRNHKNVTCRQLHAKSSHVLQCQVTSCHHSWSAKSNAFHYSLLFPETLLILPSPTLLCPCFRACGSRIQPVMRRSHK